MGLIINGKNNTISNNNLILDDFIMKNYPCYESRIIFVHISNKENIVDELSFCLTNIRMDFKSGHQCYAPISIRGVASYTEKSFYIDSNIHLCDDMGNYLDYWWLKARNPITYQLINSADVGQQSSQRITGTILKIIMPKTVYSIDIEAGATDVSNDISYTRWDFEHSLFPNVCELIGGITFSEALESFTLTAYATKTIERGGLYCSKSGSSYNLHLYPKGHTIEPSAYTTYYLLIYMPFL